MRWRTPVNRPGKRLAVGRGHHAKAAAVVEAVIGPLMLEEVRCPHCFAALLDPLAEFFLRPGDDAEFLPGSLIRALARPAVEQPADFRSPHAGPQPPRAVFGLHEAVIDNVLLAGDRALEFAQVGHGANPPPVLFHDRLLRAVLGSQRQSEEQTREPGKDGRSHGGSFDGDGVPVLYPSARGTETGLRGSH